MQVDSKEFSRRLGVIGDCADVVSLRRGVMHGLALFGITKAYHVAPLTGDIRVSRIVTNVGLSWTWERQYRARLHLIDPLPIIAKARLEAFFWPDQVDDKRLNKKQRRYLEIAAQHGAGRGVGVAQFGPNGRSGFLGAILPDGAPAPEPVDLMRLHTVAQVAFQRYCRLVPNAVKMPALSNRELEVLHWIGQGKSNSVIADILEISSSSVDVYVRRIFAKLEVSDRTMAAVKALSLGMIVSSEYERFVEEAFLLQGPDDPPLG